MVVKGFEDLKVRKRENGVEPVEEEGISGHCESVCVSEKRLLKNVEESRRGDEEERQQGRQKEMLREK